MICFSLKGQNDMKKFAVLLTMLVLFGVFTLGALAVTSTTDSIEFTAYEILYKIGVIDTFESTVLTENAVPYLHLTSKAGTSETPSTSYPSVRFAATSICSTIRISSLSTAPIRRLRYSTRQ